MALNQRHSLHYGLVAAAFVCSLASLEWADVRASAEDRENDKRDQIEQKNSYLEDAHPSVMKSVELITGQAKPSAMDAKHPIVREHEDQEPYQQYSVVDDRTP